MFKKLISVFFALVLAGCAGQKSSYWNDQPSENWPAGRPTPIAQQLQFGGVYGTYGNVPYAVESENVKNIAVLLPLGGEDAAVGRELQNSITLAFIQKQPKNIALTFYDISGTQSQKSETMNAALIKNPDMIIGPIFAQDAEMLSHMKSDSTPALSFTSDWSVLGYGIETMALLPYQGVEAITHHMANTNRQKIMIIAPDSESGYGMARAATDSIATYKMNVAGLMFYKSGDQDSMKMVAQKASMYAPRVAAADRAKTILSDIIAKEKITAGEKNSMNSQLEKLSKRETIGHVPFDSVLFLGDANDSKTIASFLRYYEVSSNDAKFYGTALWDSDTLYSDITLMGSEYPVLPKTGSEFDMLYSDTYGKAPMRLSSMGYDAAMISMGAVQSGGGMIQYILDSSGYTGLDGLIRFRADGTNERSLQIMQLRGNGQANMISSAATSFASPVYQIDTPDMSKPAEMDLSYHKIDPMDYISIPRDLQRRYRTTAYGTTSAQPVASSVQVVDTNDGEAVFDDEFTPQSYDSVDRKMIDNVEITQ